MSSYTICLLELIIITIGLSILNTHIFMEYLKMKVHKANKILLYIVEAIFTLTRFLCASFLLVTYDIYLMSNSIFDMMSLRNIFIVLLILYYAFSSPLIFAVKWKATKEKNRKK